MASSNNIQHLPKPSWISYQHLPLKGALWNLKDVFFFSPPRKEDPGNMLNMYFFLRRKKIPPLPSSTCRLISSHLVSSTGEVQDASWSCPSVDPKSFVSFRRFFGIGKEGGGFRHIFSPVVVVNSQGKCWTPGFLAGGKRMVWWKISPGMAWSGRDLWELKTHPGFRVFFVCSNMLQN